MSTLKNDVTVIIPVYNGFDVFSSLIASLSAIYPVPSGKVRFVIIDDCSPDPAIQTYLKSDIFFQRSDLRIISNDKNLGFIGSVNLGLAESSEVSDVLLLNSDTVIFSDVVTELQNASLILPQIGTVTPLTNHGTIGSLFNFPDGADVPKVFDVSSIARKVSSLMLPTPILGAPTGVGFAMYITRKMISKTGLLDPIYGKGYGEECDYCQRASKLGFIHLITPSSFIFHKGSVSFGEEAKKILIEKNSKTLLSRYPFYDQEVAHYIRLDPLALSRITILMECLMTSQQEIGTFHVLHSETSNHMGGTERHVQQLVGLAKDEISVVFSPAVNRDKMYCVQLSINDYSQKEYLNSKQAEWFLGRYLIMFTNVHVHHLLNLDQALVKLINEKSKNLILTVHDYFAICPSVNLLTGPSKDKFCHAETDTSVCNKCLLNFYGMPTEISQHRERYLATFKAAKRIIFPSKTCFEYTKKVFPEVGEKSYIIPHDLEHYFAVCGKESLEIKDMSKVVFLGAIGKHKGSGIAIEAANKLSKAYSVEIWGAIDDQEGALSPSVNVIPYFDIIALRGMFLEKKPFAVILPSIWAETFCYTFYEAVILGQAIPIVFPFGNPADQIKAHGSGIIMKFLSSQEILIAVDDAKKTFPQLATKVRAYRERLKFLDKDFKSSYQDTKLRHTYRFVNLVESDLTFIGQVWLEQASVMKFIKKKLIRYPLYYRTIGYVYKKFRKLYSKISY